MNTQALSVREIQASDVALIISYWLTSPAEHLVGMGVDLSKLPSEEFLKKALRSQIELPIDKKASVALIWLLNGTPVGHCNVNQIQFCEQAYMHLHLWKSENRLLGLGSELVKKSIPYFFEKLQLQTIYCEPYALNSAPNRTLLRLGFSFVKTHTTVPGTLNFEQEVNLWKLEKKI